MDVTTVLTSAGKGAIGGVLYGVSAYSKNKSADATETFDAKLFITTLGVSALAGVLVEFAGGEMSTVVTALESAGVTVILQKVYGAVFKPTTPAK